MVNMKQKLVKKIVKSFDSFAENTIFKLSDKINNFFKKRKIIKFFDSFIEKTILNITEKIKYITKNNSKVSNLNKTIIIFISSLFIFLFYLLIPTLYSKTWVQNTIENKLLEDFKINFSVSSDITYYILPTPHFLIKNSKIYIEDDTKQKAISEIKNLKVFIDKNNFFNKEKMNINKILIDKANFSLQEVDLIHLNKNSSNKFSKKKIKINNSSIFFKNYKKETVAIMKVPNAIFFYDDLSNMNLFNLNGKIFNSPFSLNWNKDFLSYGKKIIILEAKKLKLKIFNESAKQSNDSSSGTNIISMFNSKIQTRYSINKKTIIFENDKSKIKNKTDNFKGNLSVKPFDLKLDINLEEYNLSKLFNTESVIGEIIKSKLLFNENISANILLNINSNKNNDIFKSSVINLNIINKKINFDKTILTNKKVGILEIKNSDLFYENDKLIFNTDVIIKVKNSNNLFSLFQTPRKSRKDIKNIFINLDYDLLTKQINVNNFKIDGSDSNDDIMDVIAEFNNSEDYNFNKSKRVFNKLFAAYDG